MAKISLIVDTRQRNAQGLYPIQFHLSHHAVFTSISTGVTIRQEHGCGDLDRAVRSVCPNAKQINEDLQRLYFKYSNALRELLGITVRLSRANGAFSRQSD